jgi:hypothetical protein
LAYFRLSIQRRLGLFGVFWSVDLAAIGFVRRIVAGRASGSWVRLAHSCRLHRARSGSFGTF